MTRFEQITGVSRANISTALRSGFMRNFAGVGGLTGIDLGLGLLIAILLARALGVEGLGIYSLALATVTIAGIPVELGLPNLIMREIAHCEIDPESGAVKGVLIFATVVIVMMCCIVIPPMLMFRGALVPGDELTRNAMLPTALGLIPLSAFGKAIGAALAGKQRIISGLVPQRLVRPGIFAIILVAVSLIEPGWLSPVRAMALHLVAASVALAVGGLLFTRHFMASLRRHRTSISWRVWALATLRLGVSGGIRVGQDQILLLLTGALSGAENVGLLRIAQRAAGLVGLGTTIAYVAAAPHIARLNAEKQHDRLQRLLRLIARASCLVAALVLVCFIFAGNILLDVLFGADFVGALGAIVVLAATELTRAMFGPGIVLMNMARREGTAAVGFAILLVVSTSVGWTLIPVYGAIGAAWGTCAGVTVMAVFIWHKSRQMLFLDPSAFGWSARRADMNEIR